MPLDVHEKILFVFSDPGGAKPCLSLIENNGLTDAVAISDRTHSFYSDFNVPVKIVKNDYEGLLESIQPALVFTGTSYTSDIERQFINIALGKKIRCYSFIDHWTSMVKRFKNPEDQLILPDQVWVIDERAKRLAIGEGIDKDKIVISGNPYHAWLKRWVPSISKDGFLREIGVSDGTKKILLFAPDPLSNLGSESSYGFDELKVSRELAELFCLNQDALKNWKVLVKAHPNQDRSRLTEIFTGNPFFEVLTPNVDTNTAMFYSDVVMGFFSSILIEASIMNKRVLRFLDSNPVEDPIYELNIGPIVDRNSFITELNKTIV
ncbi:MAG TPA: hypothetical protein VKR32_07120 [Puia sp.]|nr:hypothetical protein [Puia sp.]